MSLALGVRQFERWAKWELGRAIADVLEALDERFTFGQEAVFI